MTEPNATCLMAEDLRGIRDRVLAALRTKGHDLAGARTDLSYRLGGDRGGESIPIDAIVYRDDRPVFLVKCVTGNLVYRERASVSLARLYGDTPIPFAIVANDWHAVVLDVRSGKSVGFGYDAFPDPATTEAGVRAAADTALTDLQRERETRILDTYVHLRCGTSNEPF